MTTPNAKYELADTTVPKLADTLISKHWPEIGHLKSVRIAYLFALEEMKSSGRRVLGKAVKVSPRDAAIHGNDFIVILDKKFWTTEPGKREPLLFHELLHCGLDDDGKPSIVAHDIEEFGAVVAHYGRWKSDVERFAEQLELSLTHEGSG